jgi:hypothetical protein
MCAYETWAIVASGMHEINGCVGVSGLRKADFCPFLNAKSLSFLAFANSGEDLKGDVQGTSRK